MVRTIMTVGLLVASALSALATNADAGFLGFGIKGYSELTAVVDLNEVRNLKFDQEVTITGSLNFIEVICLNPQDKSVTPGNAGTQTVATTQAVTRADLTDRAGNKATVVITFAGDELALAEQTPGACNNLWTVVPGSAAAKSLSLTLTQERLSNQGLVVVDTLNVICTLNPILRHPESAGPGLAFTPLHDQVFTCGEVN